MVRKYVGVDIAEKIDGCESGEEGRWRCLERMHGCVHKRVESSSLCCTGGFERWK